jgi:hypothetical protein
MVLRSFLNRRSIIFVNYPFRGNRKILKKFSVRFADIGKIVYFLPESNENTGKNRLFSGRVIWSGRFFRLCKIGKIVATGRVKGAPTPFLSRRS